MNYSRIFGFALAIIAGVVTLFVSFDTTAIETPELFNLIIENYFADTNANNSVASIYLNYRVFDTIFEALMLLVSVMGVIHFSRHEHDILPTPKIKELPQDVKNSSLNGIALLIPIILMLGIYLIVNGHNTPGGGFQGGAALCAAFVCVYLVRPKKVINFLAYERLEKILFLLIAAIAIFFAVSNLYFSYTKYNVAYLIIMNLLIGLKVFCGLTIVFYRFVHYEDI